MIEISNLRKICEEGQTILTADVKSDIERNDIEKSIWISVDNKYSFMLNDKTYDFCLALPLYMAMYYKTDLMICGNVSKKLYRNVVDYIQPIMRSFSPDLEPVRIMVDGFSEVENSQTVNGTGISCGVDSLATVYKYYELEKDSEYRLTHLFFLNCGWHGSINNPVTMELFNKRADEAEKAANDMNLPLVRVNSNLHAFLYPLDDQASYFNLYTIVFFLGSAMNRYYLSSSFSYNEVMQYGYKSRGRDFSEYGDPMTLPLYANDTTTIVSDGCQYKRSVKTELIADWKISKKYLNVCCRHSDDPNVDEKNCSECLKCNRTMVALDAMGKLNEYSEIFDLTKYQKNKKRILFRLACDYDKDAFSKDNFDFCKQNGMKMPSLKWIIFAKKCKKIIFSPLKIMKKQ